MRTPRLPPQIIEWPVSDGYVPRARLWRPAGPDRKGLIVYLHGIQSHGRWFEWSAALLAESGNTVILPDRRGSGLNQPARGDTPSAQRWLDDLDELVDRAALEFAIERLAVVGVSWGGKLAAAWALRSPQRVRRLLLIAPGLFPAVDVGLAGRVRIGVSLLTRPTRTVPLPLNDPALFTDHPAGRAFIAADPLKLTHATARFFCESARLDRRLVRAAQGALHADTTLILAGRDRIIRNAPTVRWLKRLAARPPAIQIFPDAAHTLEFEPDVTEFGRLIAEWAAR
jgi:alpha-beta hydrolase superfamily lysophospholipase